MFRFVVAPGRRVPFALTRGHVDDRPVERDRRRMPRARRIEAPRVNHPEPAWTAPPQSVNNILGNAVSDITVDGHQCQRITGVLNSVSKARSRKSIPFPNPSSPLPPRPSCWPSMPASWPPTPAKPAAALPLSPRRSSSSPTRPAMSRATWSPGSRRCAASSTSCRNRTPITRLWPPPRTSAPRRSTRELKKFSGFSQSVAGMISRNRTDQRPGRGNHPRLHDRARQGLRTRQARSTTAPKC
jgi:hypothetical protein